MVIAAWYVKLTPKGAVFSFLFLTWSLYTFTLRVDKILGERYNCFLRIESFNMLRSTMTFAWPGQLDVLIHISIHACHILDLF